MNRKVSVILGVLAGLAITGGGMWVHINSVANGAADPLAGFESAAAAGAWAALLYFVMIAGVLANHLYAAASERANAGQPFANLTELVGSLRTAPRLWMAMAISPFIFHTVHLMAGDVPNGATSLFFAFQNGFFWQAVFAGFQQKVAAQPVPA